MTFKDLGLDVQFLRALESEGYTHPTPIQQQAIPIVLQGDDLIGCAQTGTGKTAAFSLPILQQLQKTHEVDTKTRQLRALILAPTRELAIQIGESLQAYGRFTRLRSTVIFGGVSSGKQIAQLRQGIDILVATPGRLLDLLQQGHLSLNHIEMLVLDEADRMLDMGFIHDINRIMLKLPDDRQTLLFSATMSPEVRTIAAKYLHHPKQVTVKSEKDKQGKIEEAFYFVEKPAKVGLLRHLIRTHSIKKGIVFTRTKYGADKLAKILSKSNIPADAIHGNKSQSQRQRALENFRNGRIHILVASDIAARGIDIDDITHVFNYEIPEQAETYVHRIGRTGRAGSDGIAISLCSNEERELFYSIEQLLHKRIPIVEDHPYSEDTYHVQPERHLHLPRPHHDQPHKKRQHHHGSRR